MSPLRVVISPQFSMHFMKHFFQTNRQLKCQQMLQWAMHKHKQVSPCRASATGSGQSP